MFKTIKKAWLNSESNQNILFAISGAFAVLMVTTLLYALAFIVSIIITTGVSFFVNL